MLEIRPNCECCDRDLPPDSGDAMICTYECTFCRDCVEDVLKNVCPNCGGGFQQRPVRPRLARREGVGRSHQPASTERVITRYDREAIAAFAIAHANIPPEER